MKEIECYICEGFGEWEDGTICPECKGTGKISVEAQPVQETCSICGKTTTIASVDEKGQLVCLDHA